MPELAITARDTVRVADSPPGSLKDSSDGSGQESTPSTQFSILALTEARTSSSCRKTTPQVDGQFFILEHIALLHHAQIVLWVK